MNEGIRSWSHLEINQYVVHHINKFKENNSCNNVNNYRQSFRQRLKSCFEKKSCSLEVKENLLHPEIYS